NLDRGLGPGGGLLERDLEVVAEIGAALRTAAPAALPEDVAEAEDVAEPREDVGEVGEDGRIESSGARSRAADAGVAEAIVHAPLLAVREHRVRLGGFLERLFGLLVARIAIGMVFQRQLAIRALDLLLRRLPIDSQALVLV